MKKFIKANFADLILVFFLILILLGGLVKPFINPISLLASENRYANKLPKITMNNIMKESTHDKINLALGDQLPLATKIKKAYIVLRGNVFLREARLISNAAKDQYIPLFDVSLLNGRLVYKPLDFSLYKKDLDKMILKYNKIIKNNRNQKYYFYLVTQDVLVDFNNKPYPVKEYLLKGLETSNVDTFNIESFNDFKNKFYSTDHHWNNIGQYEGYREILKLLNLKDKPAIVSSSNCNNYLSGSKAQKLGGSYVLKEKICYEEYELPNYQISVEGKSINYGDAIFNQSENKITNYGSIYGWDYGQIIYTNNDSVRNNNLLIVADSMSNSINKLLANHFKNTHIIDVRHYKRVYGKKFEVNEYAKSHNINDILILGTGYYFINEDL